MRVHLLCRSLSRGARAHVPEFNLKLVYPRVYDTSHTYQLSARGLDLQLFVGSCLSCLTVKTESQLRPALRGCRGFNIVIKVYKTVLSHEAQHREQHVLSVVPGCRRDHRVNSPSGSGPPMARLNT